MVDAPKHDVSEQVDAIVESIVREACISLFKDYSLPIRSVRPGETGEMADDGFLYCGVIGFCGEQARGTLMLATSSEPLGRTSPVTDGSPREWIAELSNQLLGRIKSRLLRRGITVYVSTPVVFGGKHLAPLPRAELEPYSFASDDGLVCVWFDLELAAGVALAEESDDAEQPIDEGAGVMF